MRTHRIPRAVAAVVLTTIAVLAACSNSTGPLAPFQPQISNLADNFQFQATGVTNATWTYTYSWSNSADTATVNQATTVTGGAAVLTVFDKNGTQLYSQSLNANGTFGMIKGVAGIWTVRVVFTGYSGTVNFRVQKA